MVCPGAGDGFATGGDVQFGQNIGNVGFDGALGDDQLFGDQPVGGARGQQVEHFHLAGERLSAEEGIANGRGAAAWAN